MAIANSYITISSSPASPVIKPDETSRSHNISNHESNSQILPLSSQHNLATYNKVQIKDLIVGPARVNFQGRIVNLTHWQWSRSAFSISSGDTDSRPAGYFKLIVCDGTGLVVIKMYYASQLSRSLYLGSLLSVYITHVSPKDPNLSSAKHVGFFVSIFPERDPTAAMDILDETENDLAKLCRAPLGYLPGLRYLRGLKSLVDIKVDAERTDSDMDRILVIVKSIGAWRTVVFKKDDVEKTAQAAEVLVRDSTGEAALSLWEHYIASARQWKAGQTVLLISQPIIKSGGSRSLKKIILGPTTTVEIDPDLDYAIDLRLWAASKEVEESVNLSFPTGVFDLETFHRSAIKIKFNLADIDEFVRAKEKEAYLGYFSFIILGLNLVKIHARKMLCCGDCCRVPIFANSVEELCQSCGREIQLRINPHVIERLADETGSILGQKLVWTTEAWGRLFGRSTSQLVQETPEEIRNIEDILLYNRIILLMGWTPDISRLAVCEVHV